MMHTTIVLLSLVFIAAGCSSAEPSKWVMYARANYLQGRLEAKGETLCVQPGQTPAQLDFCAEAKTARDTIRAVKPGIEAELSKEKPDIQRIMQYIDLVFSLAGKVL